MRYAVLLVVLLSTPFTARAQTYVRGDYASVAVPGGRCLARWDYGVQHYRYIGCWRNSVYPSATWAPTSAWQQPAPRPNHGSRLVCSPIAYYLNEQRGKTYKALTGWTNPFGTLTDIPTCTVESW